MDLMKMLSHMSPILWVVNGFMILMSIFSFYVAIQRLRRFRRSRRESCIRDGTAETLAAASSRRCNRNARQYWAVRWPRSWKLAFLPTRAAKKRCNTMAPTTSVISTSSIR